MYWIQRTRELGSLVHFCINGIKGRELIVEDLLASAGLDLDSELGPSEFGALGSEVSAWSCREGYRRDRRRRIA